MQPDVNIVGHSRLTTYSLKFNYYIIALICAIIAASLICFELTGRVQFFIKRVLAMPVYKSQSIERAAQPMLCEWRRFNRRTRIIFAFCGAVLFSYLFAVPSLDLWRTFETLQIAPPGSPMSDFDTKKIDIARAFPFELVSVNS